MSNKSLGSRLLAAAVIVSLTATLALMSQPSGSSGSRSPNQADHHFVPTMVAIAASHEEPAPTF